MSIETLDPRLDELQSPPRPPLRPADPPPETPAPKRSAEEPDTPGPSARLVSLDAFRGLAILGMLLVNNMALDTATPRQFVHAAWNEGVHFADLVFPWFLLIVGVAIPFSHAASRRRGISVWRYDLKVLTRMAVLVLLGCLITSSIAKQPVFGLGVLQLIGLAYCVGALLYGLSLESRLLMASILLVGHWAAIRFIPVPGVGAGVFTESGNLIAHLNQAYLGPVHLKGLISVVPTGALLLIGTAIGDVLRADQRPARKVAILLIASGGMMLVGWLWNLDLPFNKPVWTAPYILYAGGLGTFVLAVLYLVIDVNGWKGWSLPLVVYGSNAIFAYVAPILVKLYILREWTVGQGESAATLQQGFLDFFVAHSNRIAGGWLYTASYLLIWGLILWAMHRKRVFIRI